jgi:hypothetical protein
LTVLPPFQAGGLALKLHLMGVSYGQRPSRLLHDSSLEDLAIDWIAWCAGKEFAERVGKEGYLFPAARVL